MICTAVFWVAATTLAVRYQRHYGRGPAERLYLRSAT